MSKQLQMLHRDSYNAVFTVRFKSEQVTYVVAYTGLSYCKFRHNS